MNRKIIKQEATYDFLKDEVHCLYEEKKELQQRIDKAIEYVENNNFYKTGMTEEGICYVVSCDKKELLDILKGSDSSDK